MSVLDNWEGLRLLNTGRGNAGALRTLNRADANMDPRYWNEENIADVMVRPNGITGFRLADGTFGLRIQHIATGTWFVSDIHLSNLHGEEISDFQLLGFGGTLTSTRGSFSANLGTVSFLQNGRLEYRVRMLEPSLRGDIWIRYSLGISNENITIE